jgi:hypothetical protein
MPGPYIYYVGAGGNNANNGTTWALRKLTLNGAEDIPVAAGDTVYVGPGTYRETLTVDVSGGAGSPITYIGDYSGANTDGVGGVVRITGSDNDQTATRNNCIVANAKNYRTFSQFVFDLTAQNCIAATDAVSWIISKCAFFGNVSTMASVALLGASQAAVLVQQCMYLAGAFTGSRFVHSSHSSTVNSTGHVVENCVALGGYGLHVQRVGGITIRNTTGVANYMFVRIETALAAGQTLVVNNCTINSANFGFYATAAGEIVENYNSVFGAATAYTNTNTGANSNTYPALFDTRWFFEAVAGGKLLAPFDLASYSQLVNLAGTSPTTTDLRGTAVQGAQREWGALEYDPALLIKLAAGGGLLINPGLSGGLR